MSSSPQITLRPINNEEIDRICNSIVNTYPDIDTYQYAIDNIRHNIREQLEGLEIVDNDNIIDDLIEIIGEKYVLSKVPNEMFKGLEASHVMNQFTTQSILHTKRGQGGNKSFISAFDTIEEYLKFSEKLKENIVYTHLKQLVDYEYSYRLYVPMFTEVNLGQIVTTYSLHDLTGNNPLIPDMSWYDTYYELGGIRPINNNIFIRLTLDKYAMYEMKISIDTLVSTLSKSSDNTFIIVPAPSYLATIDIYANVDALVNSKYFQKNLQNKLDHLIGEEHDNSVAKLFLYGTFIPNLNNMQVSGIAGVEYVQPNKILVSSILKEEKNIYDTTWEILWDQITATNKGILFENIRNLFDILDIELVQYNHIPDRFFIIDWIYDHSPLSIIKSLDLSSQLISEINTDDKEYIITYDSTNESIRTTIDNVFSGLYNVDVEHLKTNEGLPDNRFKITGWNNSMPPISTIKALTNQFINANELVFLEIHTMNYEGILGHDRVDARRTITNNPKNMLFTLGIEALRNAMIVNIGRLLEDSGSEFNFRHIDIIVDHFTMQGYPTPVSMMGVEGQRLGPFTESTFQEGDKILMKAAQFGRTDNINTPSAYLTLGKKGAYGRDYAATIGRPLSNDPTENDIYNTYRNNNLTTEHFKEVESGDQFGTIVQLLSRNMVQSDKYIDLMESTRNMNTMPPTLTINDIVNTLEYSPNSNINLPQLHIGQRKLFISELQFLTKYVPTINTDIFVVYAGAAPGNHIGYLASLFPDITFILVDPNPFQVYIDPKYNVTMTTISTNDELTDLLTMSPDKLSNIYTMQSLFTNRLAQDISDTMDNIEEGLRPEILFISDIRTAAEESPKDFDIIWNLAQQYNWIFTIIPMASLIKFRHPFYEDSDDFEARLESNELARNDILKPLSQDYVDAGLSIDFVENYRNKILQYFNGTVNIQAWPGKRSTETRLDTNGSNVETFDSDYESKLFYYNNIDRSFIYHTNNNADTNIGFDHCNDCAIENNVWIQYLSNINSNDNDIKNNVIDYVTELSGPATMNRTLLYGNHGHFYDNPISMDLLNKAL